MKRGCPVDQSEEYVKYAQALLAAVFLAAAGRSLGKECAFCLEQGTGH